MSATYDTIRTLILSADDAARTGAESSLRADLELAYALKGTNVKAFVAKMSTEARDRDEAGVYVSDVAEMFRTPGTWGKVVSQARALLKHYGPTPDAVMTHVDRVNADRRASRVNGDGGPRESYSLAYWYGQVTPATPRPAATVTTVTNETMAVDYVTTTDDVDALSALVELATMRLAELAERTVDTSKLHDAA